jgi:hypothetical protein
MILSVRKKLRRGDKRWLDCIEPLGLPPLFSEIRTIDYYLNPYAPHVGDEQCTPETLDQVLGELPIPDPNNEYYQLAINLLTESESVARLPDGWKLLGHDLSDETQTSSLHNCGRWEGQLEPLTHRLNNVGLLSLADAELARKLLPLEWGEQERHAHVTIWALYERE